MDSEGIKYSSGAYILEVWCPKLFSRATKSQSNDGYVPLTFQLHPKLSFHGLRTVYDRFESTMEWLRVGGREFCILSWRMRILEKEGKYGRIVARLVIVMKLQ